MARDGENRVTGAEAMVRLLELHGVEVVFGLCGDTSLPFYDALYRLGSNIRHVLARDERHAAYMADGYARVTGKVGVCEGPSGGGATYILPGLVEANESSVPILAVTSDISVAGRGRYTLTELDQAALMRPLTKWNTVIESGAAVPSMVRRAFREMTGGRCGAAHLGFPIDVQQQVVDEAEIWADARFGRFPAHRLGPEAASVAAFAEKLKSAERPLIICGGGVVLSGGEAALKAVAEKLDAVVATTISGQGSIEDGHPLALGVVGSNGGTLPTRAVVDEADLVLFIGCRAGSVTTERWRHPAKNGPKILHIDIDPSVIGANYPTEDALIGDARACLEALGRALEGRPAGDAAARVERRKAEKFGAFAELARSEEWPIRPERVVATLEELLPEDAILVADPGTPCPYFSAYFRQRRPGRQFISNRAHGALGYAMAAAMGAHVGRPGVKTVAAMGDGSFGMAVGELETIVRKRLPLTMIVFANATYGWIKAGQKAGFGERYYSVEFGESNHAAIAKAYGVRSWRVEDPHELRPALKAALEAEGPTLVEVVSQSLEEARAPVSEWIA